MGKTENFLEVRDLKKYFPVSGKSVFSKKLQLKAVDGVSFGVAKGKTLGLVGESGCGKSTIGRTITRLYEPTSGDVIFAGQNITHIPKKQLLPLRRRIQMIFQDPYASLNPRMTVTDIIGEGLSIHNIVTGSDRQELIFDILKKVGLKREHASRYPHEFSGGQRQRIGIARALVIRPELVVCDEPISALDVSIQAQVVNMLEQLQDSMELTYLFIAHDLSMVKHISDRIAVMYLGSLVETAGSDELYRHPQHPYTKALLSSVPVPDPDKTRKKEHIRLQGEVPSPIGIKAGCRFHTRCPLATERCAVDSPKLREISSEHYAACHNI